MTAALLEAYREDIRIRIEGPELLPSTPGIVNAHDVVPGGVYEDDQVTVEAFAVPHGVWEHAYGYKFTSADRTIVISGDTGPFDGLAEIATGADVLIHEVYGTGGFNQRSPVNQQYHGTFHTSGTKVGEIATAAGVGMVVLYHQLHLFGESPEDLCHDVRRPAPPAAPHRVRSRPGTSSCRSRSPLRGRTGRVRRLAFRCPASRSEWWAWWTAGSRAAPVPAAGRGGRTPHSPRGR